MRYWIIQLLKHNKMKTKALIFILTLGLGLGLSCNDDSKETESDLDPNVFCDENLCATNPDLMQKCISFLGECLATEPRTNWNKCTIIFGYVKIKEFATLKIILS